MKSFTSIFAAAVIALSATSVQAQTQIPWDENGKWTVYPEQLKAEGGIAYDEDNGCYVAKGAEGKLFINLDGKTIDLTQVANIEVFGPTYKENPWGDEDPLGTLTINDVDNGRVNRWFGSRYKVDFKDYAAKSAKVDSIYWDVRFIAPTTETEEGFYRTGDIMIDEIVFTKSKEKDPKAISIDMWHNWTAYDETAQIDEANKFYGDDNVGVDCGGGAVLLGTGNVLGREFADLTQYAGIYAKGTPGLSLRLLFNRPSMEGGSAPITEINPVFDENGEFYFYFTDLTAAEVEKFGAAYPYVHLNAVKFPWGLPEGVSAARVSKFNYIEKGTDGICDIIVDNADADAPMYNVLGQRVNADYKGLVIKNGKKFINK